MFTLTDGSVSAYGLACGHIDRDIVELSGRSARIDLSWNGCTYDVNVIPFSDSGEVEPLGMVGQLCGDECTHSSNYGHSSFQAGWAQFDRLTDARRFKRRLMGMNTVADLIVACAGVMVEDGLVVGMPGTKAVAA